MTNRDLVQQELINSALNSKDSYGRIRCTIEAITGLGKTFIALFLIKALNPKSVLFLAETNLREEDIRNDIIKFKEMFNYDIYSHHKIEFMCYQSAYKRAGMYHDFVVADEIHDSLSPQYFKYYNNNRYTHLLGLSATIDKKTVYLDEAGNEYSKIDMLNSIAPIVATYTVKQGQEQGTSRKLNIIIIEHELDNIEKVIPIEYFDKATKAKKIFYKTEKDYYEYCHAKFIQAMYSNIKNDFIIRYWMNKRNTFLYNLPSKTRAVIKVLTMYNLQRNIVFGNSIEQLNKICPTVSSKHTAMFNKELINNFNKGHLNTIGSFKMLKQGVNLVGLNNVILHSYYSVEKDFIQRIGRLRKTDDIGNVIIFMTKGTQEEIWLNKIITSTDLVFQKNNINSLNI